MSGGSKRPSAVWALIVLTAIQAAGAIGGGPTRRYLRIGRYSAANEA